MDTVGYWVAARRPGESLPEDVIAWSRHRQREWSLTTAQIAEEGVGSVVYRMILNQTGYFGRGAIGELPGEIARRGFSRAFLVTDPVLRKVGTVDRVTAVLDRANIPYEIYDNVKPNPPVEDVLAGVAAFRTSGADFLIGVGGGSPQDVCKAIGIVVANPDHADVLSLEGAVDTKHRAVPIIGVPTTAGTASETTINYVITDTVKKRKFVCVDPHDIPLVAIVDPDLMDGMPRGLKVATGLDALTHAIEGYITPGAWELSDAVHLKSIQLIAANLSQAADGDPDAVEKMAFASYIAGVGYSNVGLGLVHGMSHPLGGMYNVAHGVANGLLLVPVLRYNAEYTGERYRDIAAAFGVADAYRGDLSTVRDEAVEAVAKLASDLGNPMRLSEVGVPGSALDALAEAALVDVCTGGNPRRPTLQDIHRLYASIL